jgi:hypothetical protein
MTVSERRRKIESFRAGGGNMKIPSLPGLLLLRSTPMRKAFSSTNKHMSLTHIWLETLTNTALYRTCKI